MLKRKSVREKGKLKLSQYFQEFDKGDRVAVKRELSVQPKFPKQLQGRSGVVDGTRGSSYLVKINDMNKEKTYIIHPVHLKKLK
jgi:large subunit ribosomal protein L21e